MQMNKKHPMEIIYLLQSLGMLLGALIVANSGQTYDNNIQDDDDTVKELVNAINNGKDDDNLNWKEFKDSKLFKQVDVEIRQQIVYE